MKIAERASTEDLWGEWFVSETSECATFIDIRLDISQRLFDFALDVGAEWAYILSFDPSAPFNHSFQFTRDKAQVIIRLQKFEMENSGNRESNSHKATRMATSTEKSVTRIKICIFL